MNRGAKSRQFDHGELIDLDLEGLRTDFRRLRLQRRVSQLDIASLLKVSQATISSFEQGKHDRIRPKTLRGIHEMVTFWKRETGVAQNGTSSNRGLVTASERGPNVRTGCPRCGANLPEPDASARYCPFCSNPLGLRCACGHFIQDAEANYCSRCGTALCESAGRVSLSEDGALRFALQEVLHRCIEHGDLVDRIVADLRQKLQPDT